MTKKDTGKEKTGTFIRLPSDLKEEVQIWCIKNRFNGKKLTMTDLIIEGIKKIIRE
jgi:hypothetical protein